MHNESAKLKVPIKEWMFFTLMFFLLYDLIWIVAGYDDFICSLENEGCLWMVGDFFYCGTFSFLSLSINHALLRKGIFNLAKTDQRSFLVNAAVAVAINIVFAVFCELVLSYMTPDFIGEDVWGSFFLFGIISSLLTLLHLLLHYSDAIIKKNKENVTLIKKYLKLQLNPHFVFNNLSSLAGMIIIDPQKAEEYVVHLSHVYRYMIRYIDQDYITINEARDFAALYVSMLNMRYNNKIVLQMDDGRAKDDECILSLSLQLLIENAVKHNVPHDDKCLYIRISVKDRMLSIENNRIIIDGRSHQMVESCHLGLKNLERRYELECGKKIEYNITPDLFGVSLPIIHK